MVDEGERQIEFLETSLVGLQEKVEELNATGGGGDKEHVEPVPAVPPFSMALIDGNDFIFTPDFLRDGFQGGKRAARTLQLSLFKIVKERFASEDDSAILDALARSIIAQVFINRAGLTDKLIKGGVVATAAIFSDWLAGFLSAQTLFSVVDVGASKDATGIRIREHLRVYSAQPSCRTLFLGAPRGVEYATFLSDLRDSPRIKDIVLLRGYDKVEKEFKPFQDLVVETPGLFIKDKIKWRTPAQASSDLARIDDQDFDLPPLPPLHQELESAEATSRDLHTSSSPISSTSPLPPQALPLNPFAPISSEPNASVDQSSPSVSSSQPLRSLVTEPSPSTESFVKAPVVKEETAKEARERRRKMREKQAEGSQSSSAVGEETRTKPVR
ncbi:hypothetical protein BDY24DRAFT_82087 [Mrakia frigida]|uniref:uncharacterized protein n=1 Tax=Mrakia frigida TaxID=29902 RepID=UPI003FCC092D